MKITEIEAAWLKANIGKIDFLKILEPHEIILLTNFMTPRVLMGNQPVIREGQLGHSFFLIFNGRVSVWVERKGKKAKLATLNKGDYFGEISLLTGKPTTANVIANSPSKVFFMNSDQFVSLVRSNPKLASHIKHVMKERIEKRQKAIDSLLYDNLDHIQQAIEQFLKSDSKEQKTTKGS